MSTKQIRVIFTLIIASWMLLPCRSDSAEGSRLLEEAFRDYDKRIRPNYGGLPVYVNVSMHILSVSEVDISRMTFSISFYIRQMWIDPRLSFNSRRNIDTITLDAATSERIWVPDTFFANEVSSVSRSSLVKNQFSRIAQDGTVLFSKMVTLTAFSPMKTNLFPYDYHQLRLDLESYGSTMKDIIYSWTEEDISFSHFISPGFFILSCNGTDSSAVTPTGEYSRLTIGVTVKRISLPYELGLLLPVGVILILCMCTASIKKPGQAIIVSIYLISLIAILHGLLLLSGIGVTNRGSANVPIHTPLHIYLLLAFGFGIVCLMVNIIREQNEQPGGNNEASGEQDENKSRTESTENCKSDELQPSNVNASLSSRNSSAEGTKKNWSRIRQWKKTTTRSQDCIRGFLWTLFFVFNATFLIVFRSIS